MIAFARRDDSYYSNVGFWLMDNKLKIRKAATVQLGNAIVGYLKT